MNLKPYPEYKDSGVAWLGDVPKHWEMRKFRTILTPVAERNRPDLPLLSVVREKGVIERNIKDDSENHNYIPDDLSKYKVVKYGQFVMNKMKAWQGSYGISKFNGIVSPAYFVFDLKCIEPDFFHKAVRSRAYVPFFTQASDGVRVGQWDLSQTRMKEMPFFIPSSEEQLAIARFLDYKTAQTIWSGVLMIRRTRLLEPYLTPIAHEWATKNEKTGYCNGSALKFISGFSIWTLKGNELGRLRRQLFHVERRASSLYNRPEGLKGYSQG